MDYKILTGKSAKELEAEVIKFLKKGYKLAGGHQVTTVGYRDYTNGQNALREIKPDKWEITQAVYKETEEKTETVIKEKVMI